MIVVAVEEDPAVRADGRCAVCPKLRDLGQSSRYAKDAAALDPFCSATCARMFHGTSLPPVARGGVYPTFPKVAGS